jgi:hypothetical protein
MSVSPDALACGHGAHVRPTGVWVNPARRGGAARHPGLLTKYAADPIAQGLGDVHAGLVTADKMLAPEEGKKLDPIGILPEDAKLLAGWQFSVAELGRLNCVPLAGRRLAALASAMLS